MADKEVVLEKFIGKPVPGVALPVPNEEDDTVPGQVYAVVVDYEPADRVLGEKELSKIKKEIEERFKAKVLMAASAPGKLVIQLEGSPFAWSAFVAWLPGILAAIGVVMILYGIYVLIETTPSWVLALIVVGAALIFIANYLLR